MSTVLLIKVTVSTITITVTTTTTSITAKVTVTIITAALTAVTAAQTAVSAAFTTSERDQAAFTPLDTSTGRAAACFSFEVWSSCWVFTCRGTFTRMNTAFTGGTVT